MAFKDEFGMLLERDILGEMAKNELALNEDYTLPKMPESLTAEQIVCELRHILKTWEGRGGLVAFMRLKELAKVILKENETAGTSSDPALTTSMAQTAASSLPEKKAGKNFLPVLEGNEVVIRVWRGLASVTKKPKGIDVAILDYDVQDADGEAELARAKEIAKTCDVVVKVKGGVADVEKKPKGIDVKIVDKD